MTLLEQPDQILLLLGLLDRGRREALRVFQRGDHLVHYPEYLRLKSDLETLRREVADAFIDLAQGREPDLEILTRHFALTHRLLRLFEALGLRGRFRHALALATRTQTKKGWITEDPTLLRGRTIMEGR